MKDMLLDKRAGKKDFYCCIFSADTLESPPNDVRQAESEMIA